MVTFLCNITYCYMYIREYTYNQKEGKSPERRNTMITTKEAFNKAQNSADSYDYYEEYREEWEKKIACERARVFKQREFKRESAWDNIKKKARRVG